MNACISVSASAGQIFALFLRWKKTILVIPLTCGSKHSRGSNRTPRFLTHALSGMAKPSNHSETVSNFLWSSFEPIMINYVFPVLSCRKFSDIQLLAARWQPDRTQPSGFAQSPDQLLERNECPYQYFDSRG